MNDYINIGLLGSGTVGGGVIKILENNGEMIARKVGKSLRISKIFGRNIEKMQANFGDSYEYTTNVDDILEDPEIDIVVELIGREHPAMEYMSKALENGKQVVTANKDVIAHYGKKLFDIAGQHNADIMFEGAVCGGIPIIGPMKSSMAANEIQSIMGIVNGTTNYMLSKMTDEGLDYASVLKEAQEKGYAESDPTADVGGFDAARKAVILASIAFNMPIGMKDVDISGIQNVDACDIEYASRLGYTVKLLAIAKNDSENGVSICVTPTMIPKKHPLASVGGAYNAVFVNGNAIGEAMFLGLGAGRFPTASSVVGDIMEAARNLINNDKGRIGFSCYKEKKICPPEKNVYPSYIRLSVLDKPGVLAAIASVFGSQSVSIRNVIQTNEHGKTADLVFITHAVSAANLKMALQILDVLPVVDKISCIIRVEDSVNN